MVSSLKSAREGISQWLDRPIFTTDTESGKIRMFMQIGKEVLVYLVFFSAVILISLIVFGNTIVSITSSYFQIPHPIFVTSNDYGCYAPNKPFGIFMNTEGKIEIKQSGGAVIITIIDRDGFYTNPESANPSLYILGTRPSGLSGGVGVESKFLSEPIDTASFFIDWLVSGKYVAAIYYHEPSGLFRQVIQGFQVQ